VPFPSFDVRVVDKDDPTIVVAPGEPGELLLRGPQAFSGYWERPEETAEVVLADGWIRTGDIVVMDDDGFFTIVDRNKELIITGGFNIYPSEVENALRQLPEIADAAVVGLPSSHSDEEVTAAVVLEPGAALDENAVRAACEERLAAYKVPRRVFAVDDLPISMIGKVMRRQVRAQLLEQISSEGRPDSEERSFRVARATYLWEEYKYRHDLIWRLLFRITTVAVILSIAPFTINTLVQSRVGVWINFCRYLRSCWCW
jgi:long-chain acyl-CoA synthetase